MRTMAICCLAALTAIAGAVPALAQRGGPDKYVLLAEEMAQFTGETETFTVEADEGRFQSLRVVAERSPLRLFGITVTLANGKKVALKIPTAVIDPGPRGLDIDLPGRSARIAEISASYKTPESAQRLAIVSISGLRFIPPRAPADLGRMATAQFNLRDNDITIPVGQRAGRAAGVRLLIENRDVFISNVRVVFGNGTDQTFPLNDWIDAGSATPPLDFNDARGRFIDRIILSIRPRRGRRVANVTVLGIQPARVPVAAPARLGDQPRLDRRGLPGGYERLETVQLGDRTEPHTIRVGRRAGRITSLAFRPVTNGIRVQAIAVTYGNGQQDRFDYKDRMQPGQISRSIDLGQGRFVESVTILGRSLRRGPNASIELYADLARDGRRVSPPRGRAGGSYGSGGPVAPARGEWVLLTSRTPSLFKAETAVIPVGRRAGRLKAIRLAVKRHDVRIFGIQIVLANGRTQDVAISGTIPDRTTTNEVRLDHPFVEEIRIRFQTSLNLKGEGLVEFWGLK